MSLASAGRAFISTVRRDLRRQLLTAAQLTLFALMALIVVLLVVAPQLVGSLGASAPRIHAVAPPDVIAIVAETEPEWVITQSDSVPSTLGAEVAVIVDGTSIEVLVAKASQTAGAGVIGDRFAAAALVVANGAPAPTVSYGFETDDGSAVLTRIITLAATLLAFSVITGRAAWTFSALSRDLTLGLFEGVLARTSPTGFLGGRVVSAASAGIIQGVTLALIASVTLATLGEQEAAARVLQLATPLALWAAAGITMLVTFAMVLVLLFQGGGAASLGIVVQLLGFAAFGIVIVALLDPDAAWIAIASVIPPLSVFLLPIRLSEGRVDTGEAMLAVTAMSALIVALFWLALRAWRAATTTDGVAATWRAVVGSSPARSTRGKSAPKMEPGAEERAHTLDRTR